MKNKLTNIVHKILEQDMWKFVKPIDDNDSTDSDVLYFNSNPSSVSPWTIIIIYPDIVQIVYWDNYPHFQSLEVEEYFLSTLNKINQRTFLTKRFFKKNEKNIRLKIEYTFQYSDSKSFIQIISNYLSEIDNNISEIIFRSEIQIATWNI